MIHGTTKHAYNFLFSSKMNHCFSSTARKSRLSGKFVISVLPLESLVLMSRALRCMLQINRNNSVFFHACIREVAWNMFTRINARLLVWSVPKLKFTLTFTRLNMLNSYSEDLSFFSGTFIFCRWNFCVVNEIT